MKLSTRTRVMRLLARSQDVLTATEIAQRLKLPLASLSSTLKRLCDAGLLHRADGIGIRGGYGYFR